MDSVGNDFEKKVTIKGLVKFLLSYIRYTSNEDQKKMLNAELLLYDDEMDHYYTIDTADLNWMEIDGKMYLKIGC